MSEELLQKLRDPVIVSAVEIDVMRRMEGREHDPRALAECLVEVLSDWVLADPPTDRWNILIGYLGSLTIYNVDIHDSPEVKVAALENIKRVVQQMIDEERAGKKYVALRFDARQGPDGLELDPVD